MTITADCLWPLAAHLGEGPAWSPSRACLWFVDIKAHKIHRHVPGDSAGASWDVPDQPGFALPIAGGDLLVGMPGGLYRFAPDTGRLDLLVALERDRPGNRLNDGFVDGSGRFWFGSMADAETQSTGALYCWAGDRVICHDDGICITNGPVVSPDGLTLYHTDTLAREIHAFELASDGTTRAKRLFLTFEARFGWPDGTCLDSEGCLWIAFYGGWAVRRYSPDGRLLTTVELPCANVTKLAFGGSDLRTAYITTATKGLSGQALASQPLAGALFAFASPVAGLASTEPDFPHA